MNETIRFDYCFAADNTMIDVIHPATRKSACYGQTLKQIQERYPGAIVMTIDDFCRSKAASQDTPIVWTETTEEAYYSALEALPPAVIVGSRKNCSGGFLMGEPYDHHALNGRPRFGAFICKTTQDEQHYYTSNRPMTVAEFMAVVD